MIVGGGTVRRDNPLLTSRGRRQPEPLRVVLSRSLLLPADAQLWDQSVAPTLVAHSYEAPPRRRFVLDRLGVERVLLQACEPWALLEELARRGCNQVLWECGPVLAAAVLRDGGAQRIAAVIAPKVIEVTVVTTVAATTSRTTAVASSCSTPSPAPSLA